MFPQIVLASSSSSRKKILARLHIDFTAAPPDIDETPHAGEMPQDLVRRLAVAKARAVAAQFPHALIIGSDQVAELNGGKIIGKPRDHDDAVAQLKNASGATLTHYTGVALLNTKTGNLQSEVDAFEVAYRKLSDEQIHNYLEAAQPYDSCGSLKVEGIGIAMLKRLSGNDPNTLLGLPLIKLIPMLEAEGVRLI